MINGTSQEIVMSVGIDDLVKEVEWHPTPISSITSPTCNISCHNSNESDNAEVNGDSGLDTTKVFVLSTIIVLTVLGNVAVILAIVCRKMKMNRMYYFILHLSLADLLTAFLTLLPEVAWTFTIPYFYGGSALCKMVKFGQMVGPYLSSYVLIMTAVDRYQAICYPLSNCTWTPRRSNIMIGIAWAISLVLCIPQAVIFSGSVGDDGGPRCVAYFVPGWGVHAYVTWFAVSNFFVPLLFLLFCYTRICWAIWENFNNKKMSSSAESGTGAAQQNGSSSHGWRTMLAKWRRLGKPSGQVIMRYRFRSSKYQNKEETIANDEDSDNSRESADKQWQERENRKKDGVGVGDFPMNKRTTRITIEPPSTPSVAPDQMMGPSGEASTGFNNAIDDDDGIKSVERNRSSSDQIGGRATFAPRSSSIKGISRAKIKTVKLTVVVIVGYIVCSAPFICVQLWATFGSPSDAVLSSMVWLFWLLTLNSVVNPWIYMMFNANLVESLCHIFCRSSLAGCIGGNDRNRRHRNSNQNRFFGQNSGTATSKTNTGGARAGGGNRCNLSTGDQKSFDRSRSNSGGSQTSFTMMTTADGLATNGKKSRSPSPKNNVARRDTLSVMRQTYK